MLFVLDFPIFFELLHADGIAFWNCVGGISSSSYPLAKIITHVPDQMGLEVEMIWVFKEQFPYHNSPNKNKGTTCSEFAFNGIA